MIKKINRYRGEKVQMSFVSYEAYERFAKRNPTLHKILEIIEWKEIEEFLKNSFPSQARGQIPFDPVCMFKATLLGQWYSLSDPELEKRLSLNLDFIAFVGLDEAPDETTLCRFRNRLISNNLLEALLEMINLQLQEKQLKIKTGSIVDATLIQSACHPRKTIETIPEDRKELDSSENSKNIKISYSKDENARWLKKGKKVYFGYKLFSRVDEANGYIEKLHITPANAYEGHHLDPLLDGLAPKTRVYSDKGFTTKDNTKLLQKRKLKNALMCKASKSKSLHFWEKERNRLISKKRYIVEQSFGILKRIFNMKRASYISSEKVLGQCLLKSICFNLNKAVRMISMSLT